MILFRRIEKLGIQKKDLKSMLKYKKRKDICNDYNISLRTLDRIIKEEGLTKNNFGPKFLNKNIIKEIKIKYIFDNYKQKDLASLFGISQSLVSKIVNNLSHPKCSDLVLDGKALVKKEVTDGNKR